MVTNWRLSTVGRNIMAVADNILLVGEGNFSFSLSLSETSAGNIHITATCYETEEVVSRQPLAWDNVQQLRNRGAVVHFAVDATKLKDQAPSANKPYDRVIFNFPHCGRKAGVKKNRDLLDKFFCSCADILSEKGDVHVALCQGQGGTPADHPRRDWHNSWQVVAMAAKAGFILSAVVPFGTDQYRGYRSTGYRSQEKSFHVDGSLNHIFTRSLPMEDMIPLDIINKLTKSFQTTDESASNAHRVLLERDPCHPVRLLNERLLVALEKSLTLNRLEDTFPLLCGTCNAPAAQDSLYYVRSEDDDVSSSISSNAEEEERCSEQQNGVTVPRGGHHGIPRGSYCLRPSLTHLVEELIPSCDFAPGAACVLGGPVFRRCLVSQVVMPVYHETLILCGYPRNMVTAQLYLLMETVKSAVESISQDEARCDGEELEGVNSGNLGFSFQQDPISERYTINITAGADNLPDQRVGSITTAVPGQSSRELGLILLTLNLDLITMCLLEIPDWRLLWTLDDRFMQQYKRRQLRRFQSFSLHPPHYIHDVSFWVGEGVHFNELEFHSIAMRTSKGTITSIKLQDQFMNVHTGQSSLCYRVTYQACDRALTYDTASQMQLLLRAELQKSLHVTLR